MPVFTVIFAICLFPVLLPGQTGKISGTVLDSFGEPVQRALVEIRTFNRSGAQDPMTRSRSVHLSKFTGTDGHFEFSDVPTGGAGITVRKPGFFSEQETGGIRPAVTVTPDGVQELSLQLIKEAVISGQVVDDSRQPIENLPIAFYAQRVRDGIRRTENQRQVSTDEDGSFRIANLRPGIYFISMGPNVVPGQLVSAPSLEGYPFVFYGGDDMVAAEPIRVQAGQTIELPLSIPFRRLYRVRGTITGADGQFFSISTSSMDGNPIPTQFRPNSNGQFLGLLTAGRYRLRANVQRAQMPNLAGEVNINVQSNMEDVRINLAPLVSIPVQSELQHIGSDISRMPGVAPSNLHFAMVRLVSNDLTHQEYITRQVGENGVGLAIRDVQPGTYHVRFQPTGPWYVDSASAGLKDLLHEDLTITENFADIIHVHLRDDPAQVDGTITADNQPTKGFVIAVSLSDTPRAPFTTVGDDSGKFHLQRLPPGSYRLYAFERIDDLEYANPSTLQPYTSRATTISLTSSEKATATTQLIRKIDQ